MTLIASRASLLHTALQDLHAGKVDAARRLPKLADATRDDALGTVLRDEAGRAREQARRLAEVGGDMAGPKNLWMAGILDDAERDARSTQPGPLLDLALVGAVRKAKAAEIVSSETALALALASGEQGAADAIGMNRDEEIATDQALKAVLVRLTGSVPSGRA